MALKIADMVAKRIAKIGLEVEEKVISSRVTREINKRAEAICNVWDILDKTVIELRRTKPDTCQYNKDGELVSETFSKAAHEKKKGLEERVEKLEKALSKAIDKNDYDELYKLSAGGKDKDGD